MKSNSTPETTLLILLCVTPCPCKENLALSIENGKLVDILLFSTAQPMIIEFLFL